MSKVFTIRAQEHQKARWQEAADLAGISFNAWVNQRLNEAADLDLAQRDELEQRRADRAALRFEMLGGNDAA